MVFALLIWGGVLWAAPPQLIKTNEVVIERPPVWLKEVRVREVAARIQSKLEWSIRRVSVHWYHTPEEFALAHSLGPLAVAVTRTQNGVATVHIGPAVTNGNFDSIFGHELVHVIAFQKYKGAIPKWLEEGLANHLAKSEKVDYQWLARQPRIPDVRELAHPFEGSVGNISYRYKASQAFAEMLAKKCDLQNLIRMSVERKLENYLANLCGIKDMNKSFSDWVEKNSKL